MNIIESHNPDQLSDVCRLDLTALSPAAAHGLMQLGEQAENGLPGLTGFDPGRMFTANDGLSVPLRDGLYLYEARDNSAHGPGERVEAFRKTNRSSEPSLTVQGMLLHPGSELQQFEQAARQLSHSEKDITTSVTLFGLTSLRILHDTIEATQRNEERVVYTIGALVSRECLRMAIGKANLPSQIR